MSSKAVSSETVSSEAVSSEAVSSVARSSAFETYMLIPMLNPGLQSCIHLYRICKCWVYSAYSNCLDTFQLHNLYMKIC